MLTITTLCNATNSINVTDRQILCYPMLMALCNANDSMGWDSNQLENVLARISDIGYRMCRPDLECCPGLVLAT